MEQTKRYQVSFSMSIAQKEYSFSPVVSTNITNDVPKGEDPEAFLKKRIKEELNRMMRGIEELDFEIKDDVF